MTIQKKRELVIKLEKLGPESTALIQHSVDLLLARDEMENKEKSERKQEELVRK